MADFGIDFSVLASGNPWPVPFSLLKLSTTNLSLTNGTGLRSASNGNDAWAVHNFGYTGGASLITSEVTFASLVFGGDNAGPGVFVRSGGNLGVGFRVRVDNAGSMYIDRCNSSGGATQVASVGSISLSASDVIAITYQPSSGDIKGYQNGVLKLSFTDTTYAADTTTWAAGFWISPGNLNAQYIKTFRGTGVVEGIGLLSSVAIANQNASVLVPPYGNRRASVWGLNAASSAGIISAATHGGNAMTIGARQPTSGTDTRLNALLYDLEAIIATLSGAQTLSATISGTVSATRGGLLNLFGVDQSNPIVDFKNAALASSTGHQLPSITTVPGGFLILLAVCGSAYTNTWTAGDASIQSLFNDAATPAAQLGFKPVTGTSETPPSIATGSAAITRYSMLSLRPYAAGGGGGSGFKPWFAEGTNQLLGVKVGVLA